MRKGGAGHGVRGHCVAVLRRLPTARRGGGHEPGSSRALAALVVRLVDGVMRFVVPEFLFLLG